MGSDNSQTMAIPVLCILVNLLTISYILICVRKYILEKFLPCLLIIGFAVPWILYIIILRYNYVMYYMKWIQLTFSILITILTAYLLWKWQSNQRDRGASSQECMIINQLEQVHLLGEDQQKNQTQTSNYGYKLELQDQSQFHLKHLYRLIQYDILSCYTQYMKWNDFIEFQQYHQQNSNQVIMDIIFRCLKNNYGQKNVTIIETTLQSQFQQSQDVLQKIKLVENALLKNQIIDEEFNIFSVERQIIPKKFTNNKMIIIFTNSIIGYFIRNQNTQKIESLPKELVNKHKLNINQDITFTKFEQNNFGDILAYTINDLFIQQLGQPPESLWNQFIEKFSFLSNTPFWQKYLTEEKNFEFIQQNIQFKFVIKIFIIRFKSIQFEEIKITGKEGKQLNIFIDPDNNQIGFVDLRNSDQATNIYQINQKNQQKDNKLLTVENQINSNQLRSLSQNVAERSISLQSSGFYDSSQDHSSLGQINSNENPQQKPPLFQTLNQIYDAMLPQLVQKYGEEQAQWQNPTDIKQTQTQPPQSQNDNANKVEGIQNLIDTSPSQQPPQFQIDDIKYEQEILQQSNIQLQQEQQDKQLYQQQQQAQEYDARNINEMNNQPSQIKNENSGYLEDKREVLNNQPEQQPQENGQSQGNDATDIKEQKPQPPQTQNDNIKYFQDRHDVSNSLPELKQEEVNDNQVIIIQSAQFQTDYNEGSLEKISIFQEQQNGNDFKEIERIIENHPPQFQKLSQIHEEEKNDNQEDTNNDIENQQLQTELKKDQDNIQLQIQQTENINQSDQIFEKNDLEQSQILFDDSGKDAKSQNKINYNDEDEKFQLVETAESEQKNYQKLDNKKQEDESYFILNQKFYQPSFKQRKVEDEYLKKFIREFYDIQKYQEEYNLDGSQEEILNYQISKFVPIRGDGNCMFTSIGFQYLYYSIIDEGRYQRLLKLIDQTEFKQKYENQPEITEKEQELLKVVLIDQLNQFTKFENQKLLLERITQSINNQDGPLYGLMVIFLRNYFRKILQECYDNDNDEMKWFIEDPQQINELITWEFMYNEADIALKVFAKKEQILIKCFKKMNVEDKTVDISDYHDENQKEFPYKIGLAFQPGHYNAILVKN